MHVLKTFAFQFLDRPGFLPLLRHVGAGRNHLYVLGYHRVDEPHRRPWLDPSLISATPDQFAEQMEFIAAHYTPVSAEEVVTAIETGRSLPPRAVLVTVDDGYRDYAEFIFPIAQKYGIRSVLFVPTAYPGRGGFWWDRLYGAVINSRGETLSTPLGNYRVGTEAERQETLDRLRAYVKSLPFAEGMQFVQTLADAAPASSPSLPDTLDWDELRSLAAQGTTVAAHTHTHPLLTRIPFEEACAEIRTSLETVRREIGQVLPIFAYPDGQAQFFSEALMAYLREQGVRFAVTTVEGSGRLKGSSALCFPRLGMHPRLTTATFHLHMTPLYAWYKRNLSRSSAVSYDGNMPD